MAARPRPSALLPCASCARRLSVQGPSRPLLLQQVRGKKSAASRDVVVRLEQDVFKYGKKGRLIPLKRGTMRSCWFPEGKASYVDEATMKDVKAGKIIAERDFDFLPRASSSKLKPVEVKPAEVAFISPQTASNLLAQYIPPKIAFRRRLIETTQPVSPNQFAPERGQKEVVDEGYKSIFGSVSSGDVAASIRAALAEHKEAARIVFQDDDVVFTETQDGETDKVKTTGSFRVEVRIKGGEVVKTMVEVVPQTGKDSMGVHAEK
ncbi:hypothetical protein BDY21DRAFT_356277 [Lineolata rhizophorae]|uniref:Ribosomal protein L9 domain-containing protein n=1 Tax=Lineolata rhizophorae TaxID=578093 RepID=A0A6A6NNR1_9PEZI|nr:hypothetical protein BDY21DRAFT_356277 [Lineolata rhizophorae]